MLSSFLASMALIAEALFTSISSLEAISFSRLLSIFSFKDLMSLSNESLFSFWTSTTVKSWFLWSSIIHLVHVRHLHSGALQNKFKSLWCFAHLFSFSFSILYSKCVVIYLFSGKLFSSLFPLHLYRHCGHFNSPPTGSSFFKHFLQRLWLHGSNLGTFSPLTW